MCRCGQAVDPGFAGVGFNGLERIRCDDHLVDLCVPLWASSSQREARPVLSYGLVKYLRIMRVLSGTMFAMIYIVISDEREEAFRTSLHTNRMLVSLRKNDIASGKRP